MEAILLRWDADNNACIAAQLSVENSHRFDALNHATATAVCVAVPAGAIVEERLCTLLGWVVEVTNYDIHQGAAGALATAQLWHGGLRELEPGFPPWLSFCNRVDLVVYL